MFLARPAAALVPLCAMSRALGLIDRSPGLRSLHPSGSDRTALAGLAGEAQPQTGRPALQIVRCAPDDDQQIVAQIVELWGSGRTLGLRHPLFVREPDDTAFCVTDGELVAAVLCGPVCAIRPTAYVHLVGVRATYRRCELARQLDERVGALGCRRDRVALRAIRTRGNSASITSHHAPDMELRRLPHAESMPVIQPYAGPGQDRVVLDRWIV